MSRRWLQVGLVAALVAPLVMMPGIARADGFDVGNVQFSWPVALLFALGASLVPFWPGVKLGGRLASRMAAGEGRSLLYGAMGGVLLFLLADVVALTGDLGMGMQLPLLRLLLLAMLLAGLGFAAWRHLAAGSSAAAVGRPAAAVGRPAAGGEAAADVDARLAWIWAVGLGLHTLAEGYLLGANMTLGMGVALAPLPLISFVLHKVAEGATVGVLARGAGAGRLTLWAGLPAGVGVLFGFSHLGGGASPFVYGAAAGVLIYVLAQYLRAGKGLALWRGVMIGLTLMYLVGWLHELG